MQPILLNGLKLLLRWIEELIYLENSLCVGAEKLLSLSNPVILSLLIL